MAKINANIVGAAPFAIVVRKIGEITGNRCIGSCNTFPVDFNADSGNNEYYFIVTASDGCITDSRNIPGGISNVNCDVVLPEFTNEFVQSVCLNGEFTAARLILSNITNGTRYKLWYSNSDFPDCQTSTGIITGSGLSINLDTPQTQNTTRAFTIRVYKDSTCDNYKTFSGNIVTPASCAPQCNMSFTLTNPRC